MRGTKIFGGLVGWIKDHPGGTALISLGSVSAMWATLAIMAAVQEWSAARREGQ